MKTTAWWSISHRTSSCVQLSALMPCTLLRTNSRYNFFKFKSHVRTQLTSRVSFLTRVFLFWLLFVKSRGKHSPVPTTLCSVENLHIIQLQFNLWTQILRWCAVLCQKQRLESFSERFAIDATFKDSPPFLFLTCRPFKPPLLEKEEGSASWYDREWKLWSTTLR